MNTPNLKIFKKDLKAVLPSYGTKNSACFDITVTFEFGQAITKYSENNNEGYANVGQADPAYIIVQPGERVLFPTGLIFDIPEGYHVKFHPRSGTALKQGLVLANQTAVIDEDYTKPVFVLLTNISFSPVTVTSGTRVAQGELVLTNATEMEEIFEGPETKTDRIGGLGSTGI